MQSKEVQYSVHERLTCSASVAVLYHIASCDSVVKTWVHYNFIGGYNHHSGATSVND